MINKIIIVIILLAAVLMSGCTEIPEQIQPGEVEKSVVTASAPPPIPTPIITQTPAPRYEYRNITKYKTIYEPVEVTRKTLQKQEITRYRTIPSGVNYTYEPETITLYKATFGYVVEYAGVQSYDLSRVCSYKILNETWEQHNPGECLLEITRLDFRGQNCTVPEPPMEFHRANNIEITPYEFILDRKIITPTFRYEPYIDIIYVPIEYTETIMVPKNVSYNETVQVRVSEGS